MAQRLNDGTSGDVVIRSGCRLPVAAGVEEAEEAAVTGSALQVIFGGPSAKTKALRRKALLQLREKQAKKTQKLLHEPRNKPASKLDSNYSLGWPSVMGL